MTIFILSVGLAMGFTLGSGIATLTVLAHAMRHGYTDKIC